LRDDAVRGSGQHFDRIGSRKVLRLLGDSGDDPLAGQRVPHEDDLAFVAGNA